MNQNEIIKFSPGTPVLSGDVPAILTEFVSLLKWNITVKFTCTQDETLTDEGYKVDLQASGANIQAATDRGLFYGFQTLIRLCNESEIHPVFLKESPCSDRRGLKLYLPAPDANGISEFKRSLILPHSANVIFFCWNWVERWNSNNIRKSMKDT